MELKECLEKSKAIAAVRNIEDIDIAIKSGSKVIFMLCGNILNLAGIVKMAHNVGKKIYLHLDLIEGFGKDESSMIYIAQNIAPDGVISTKGSLLRIAQKCNLEVILRVFMIDKKSFDTALSSIKNIEPVAIEIMPGIIPSVIKRLVKLIKYPIIAGGLISEIAEVEEILAAGAVAISTSSEKLWNKMQ